MAELNTHVNVKEKIYAVRSVVPNKSNNEIVLVLQQFDFNVDKAVQAFVDGSAIQVLKEWNMTGKKKNNKRKRSKSKQHQGNKEAKDKAERPDAGPLQPPAAPQIQNGHVNGCEKDSSSTDSASEKPAPAPREKKISILEEPSKALRGVTGPNIEKSVKDLQRCTVSLTRYRVMIKEEVDSSVKKIKAAFAELHNCIIDKEVSLMAEMDKVKEEAMEILTARQKKAEELKRLTDLASQMAEMQLAELRAEIKHFVSERKYDEELGKAARFSCDIEQLKAQIMLCGEITHPKNNYSSRTPCSSLLPLLNAHATTSGKQSNFTRKSSSHTKPSEGKAANPKMASNLPSTADSSHQTAPANKQNGSASQRRRFNPQYHNNRLNGSAKPQGSGNDNDPMGKGNNRHEHRRQPHNGFRPKNKGGAKNQEASLGTKTPEAPAHPEKPRRRQHAADNSEASTSCRAMSSCDRIGVAPAMDMPEVLKSLLEHSLPWPEKRTDKEKGKEKLEEDEAAAASTMAVSASLMPPIWDKTIPYDGESFHLEYMDLDEFLLENGIPASPTHLAQNLLLPVAELEGKESASSSTASPPSSSTAVFPPSETVSSTESSLEKERETPSPIDPNCVEVDVNFNPDPADLVLSSVPGGELFNPRKHKFAEEDLKPQPMIKKAKKVFVPDEQKDEKYWTRRKKNNVAAKRSRDARRLKENQITIRAAFLEKENTALRTEVAELRKEVGKCKTIVSKYETKYGPL